MNLGKVELHLHLDGSLDLPTAYELAKSRNVIDETMTFEEFTNRMSVPSDNPSLEECLKCFAFPTAIMQDKEALELAAKQAGVQLEFQDDEIINYTVVLE